MARILIVGGGCRGRRLAQELTRAGHVLRITTRGEDRRDAIESSGAECWIGSPDRLATLRGALEGVTIACWMLASASGAPEQVHALHASRLEFFVGQAIDTTVRGLIYEARGTIVPAEVLAEGERIVRSTAGRNAIPLALLTADPRDGDAWIAEARIAVESLLAGP